MNTHVPGWYLVWYDYNQRNQLAHIYDGNWVPWFNYSYDASGNMTQRVAVSGGVNDSVNAPSQWYDPNNRPTMWENTGSGGNPYARSWYQYDGVGREVATWRDEQGGKGERFAYTSNDQLSQAWYNADQVWTGTPANQDRWVGYSYTPDILNRSTVNDNGSVVTYGASGMNQYTSVAGQAYGYDGNFNLTAAPGLSASYDAANRLLSFNSNGSSMQLVYDGLGRCVKRSVPGLTEVFAYDGWKPIVEWDGAGNFYAWNIYGPGPDEILWRYQAGNGHLRYHTDIHGNVTELLDWNGNGLEKYTYDAFGKPKITDWWGNERGWSWYRNRFMFRGREWMAEVGIYDYRNRFYHPGLGRFLQSDPIGFGGGDANLFRFCGGDPVNGSDPFGLDYDHDGRGDRDDGVWLEGITVEGSWIDERSNRFSDPFADIMRYSNGLDTSRGDANERPFGLAELGASGFSLGPALPLSPSTSAVSRVRQFRINRNTDRYNRKPGQLFISVFGSSRDPYSDSRTRLRIGADTTYHNMLTIDSLALSSDLKKAWGLHLGDPIYINGSYLGQFNDIAPQIFTIDVYDPYNQLGINWGGVLDPNYYLSNSPGP